MFSMTRLANATSCVAVCTSLMYFAMIYVASGNDAAVTGNGDHDSNKVLRRVQYNANAYAGTGIQINQKGNGMNMNLDDTAIGQARTAPAWSITGIAGFKQITTEEFCVNTKCYMLNPEYGDEYINSKQYTVDELIAKKILIETKSTAIMIVKNNDKPQYSLKANGGITYLGDFGPNNGISIQIVEKPWTIIGWPMLGSDSVTRMKASTYCRNNKCYKLNPKYGGKYENAKKYSIDQLIANKILIEAEVFRSESSVKPLFTKQTTPAPITPVASKPSNKPRSANKSKVALYAVAAVSIIIVAAVLIAFCCRNKDTNKN